MDALAEILVGLIIEVPLNAAAESKRIPAWVKALLLALFWLVVEAVLVWAAWAMLWDGEAWPVLLFTGCGCLIWSWLGARLAIELIKRRSK